MAVLSLASAGFWMGLACMGQDAPPADAAQSTQAPQSQAAPAPNETAPPEASQNDQKQPQAVPRGTEGTVTGTVYCSDNKKPARLAEVMLIPVSGDTAGHTKTAPTDLQGRFTVAGVPEGRYFISAQLSGYLNPLAEMNAERLAAMSAEERKEFEAHISSVTISSRSAAEQDIELERAAEIDGTVLYDDGSPAIGLRVDVHTKGEVKTDAPAASSEDEENAGSLTSLLEVVQRSTDDRGHFRILGVAPGEYTVSVSVPVERGKAALGNPRADVVRALPTGTLVVYADGSLRADTARTVKVEPGELSTGADVTIPLSRLHSIEGQVKLMSTNGPPPLASVALLYADTREVARAVIAQNGEFEFPFVAEGDYIVRASAEGEPAPDTPTDANAGAVTSDGENHTGTAVAGEAKGTAEVAVKVIGDLAGVTISVPDPAVQKAAAPTENADQPPAASPQ